MKMRIIQTSLATTCILLLASCALTGNDSANPQTRMVRAEDGLSLVCEVRGNGDTSLVFLHGWGGDRHY